MERNIRKASIQENFWIKLLSYGKDREKDFVETNLILYPNLRSGSSEKVHLKKNFKLNSYPVWNIVNGILLNPIYSFLRSYAGEHKKALIQEKL